MDGEPPFGDSWVCSMTEMARFQAFSYPQLRALWYAWMFNLELGKLALEYDRAGLARALWVRQRHRLDRLLKPVKGLRAG